MNFEFDIATVSLVVGAIAPAIVLLWAISWESHRRSKVVRPPQEEKLLRPPGYSLAIQLDSLTERGTAQLVWAMFWTGWAGIWAGYTARLLMHPTTLSAVICAVTLLALAVLAGTGLAVKAYRTMQERKIVRLGLRGEQATAEALHEASDAGLRVFHDIQAGDDWNIDHVAVGTKGVFLLETKARTRTTSRKSDEPNHHVKFDGAKLEFPCGTDEFAVTQARRNAGWLSHYLMKKTGQSVMVDAIVVLPGWWVEGQGDTVKAMNCKYLTKYLRGQKDRITEDQALRLTTALEEKNRTLDFI